MFWSLIKSDHLGRRNTVMSLVYDSFLPSISTFACVFFVPFTYNPPKRIQIGVLLLACHPRFCFPVYRLWKLANQEQRKVVEENFKLPVLCFLYFFFWGSYFKDSCISGKELVVTSPIKKVNIQITTQFSAKVGRQKHVYFSFISFHLMLYSICAVENQI